MKVGDLVRFKEEHPYKKLGIVVSILNPYSKPSVQVAWCNNYGTFWTDVRRLEVLSESR